MPVNLAFFVFLQNFVIERSNDILFLIDEDAGYILAGGKLSAKLREIDRLAKVCDLIMTFFEAK